MFTEVFAYIPGRTLYAYPASASYALSSTPWTANRVLASEIVAGLYSVTMDEGLSEDWSVFDGAAVPASHDAAVFSIQFESGGGLDAAGIRSAIGLASANLDTQLADIPTVAEFNARSLPSADYFVVSDYTAPPTAAANATAVWGAVSRTITGGTITTVNDKTGYSLSQAFPSNFAALGINSSGHVSRVTLVDTTTTNTDMRGTNNAMLADNYTAPPSTTNIVDAILDDELETGFSVARTLRIIAASTAGKVTGGPDGPIFRNLSDTADQITGVATEDGNRTTATYGT